MARASNDILNEYQSSQYLEILLFQADLISSDPLYLTNFSKAIEFNGNLYTQAGGLLSVSEPQENNSLEYSNYNINFSCPTHIISSYFLKLPSHGLDKIITVSVGLLNEANYNIINSYVLFKGKIANVDIIQEDNSFADGTAKSTLTITCVDDWIDSKEKRGRITSDDCQQSFHSGDKGFEFIQETADNKSVVWGGTT